MFGFLCINVFIIGCGWSDDMTGVAFIRLAYCSFVGLDDVFGVLDSYGVWVMLVYGHVLMVLSI